jgi:hypothetical protein
LAVVHVSVVAPPLATLVGAAVIVTAGAGSMDTLAEAAPMPPEPVHVSVYVEAALIGACSWLPLVPRAPVQPPDAVQAVASVDAQVSVTALPLATVLAVGVRVTVGFGRVDTVTWTLAVAALLPPGPAQVRVNAEPVARAALSSLPAVGRAPDQPPEATQLVASVVDHVNVVLPPLATALGVALIVTVGLAAIATLAVAAAMPPAPVHVSV